MLILIDREKTLHFGRKGVLTDAIKVEQVETLRLQFENTSGTVAALGDGTTFVVAIKATKDADEVLASCSSFSLSGTTYSGELDLRNDALRALTDGTRVYVEVVWTLATKPQRSDDAWLTLQQNVVTSDESVPTDGSAALIAAFWTAYVAAGSNITRSINSTTGVMTLSASGGGGGVGDYTFELTADSGALKVTLTTGGTLLGYIPLLASWPGEA